MSRVFLSLLFTALALQAAVKWKYMYQFHLKKDETAKVKISFRDKKIFLRDGLFTFRWTLYKNGALITHSSYQKVKAQHVLYKKYKLDTFLLKLVPTPANVMKDLYMLVVFDSFDKKKKEATIDIYIKDDDTKILAEFIEPNKKKGKDVR